MTNCIIWVMLGAYALFMIAMPFLVINNSTAAIIPTITILAPVVFVLLQGPREIGWKRLGLFFILACSISWSYESLSIATGFPFGYYHYTDMLGLKLGTVPLLIMPAYFGVCYISWLIARLLLDFGRSDSRRSGLIARTLTAAFITVMWDVAMDPSRATIAKAWIWHSGGGYFGVPIVNFLGWFLCVTTIFLSYGILELRFVAPHESHDRQSYAQALGLYAAMFMEFVTYLTFTPSFIFTSSGTVTDATGQIWKLRDIYESQGLVAMFTMGFVLLLGVLTLQRGRN